jgi:nucleotide-binding universal stress UspA family protein
VVFGYDGSDLARAAIAEAGQQLPAGRAALVVTVWRTFNVEFSPEPGTHLDAARADEVRHAAEQTAAGGAALAGAAGFRAQGIAVLGTPTWKAIIDTADDHDASLIILGPQWPCRAGRPPSRQRGRRRRGALAQARANRARPRRSLHLHAGNRARSGARGRPRRAAPLAGVTIPR